MPVIRFYWPGYTPGNDPFFVTRYEAKFRQHTIYIGPFHLMLRYRHGLYGDRPAFYHAAHRALSNGELGLHPDVVQAAFDTARLVAVEAATPHKEFAI